MKLAPVALALTALSALASAQISIKTLSTDPARVTGGDVLVEISSPDSIQPKSLQVMAGDRDVTASFHPDPAKPGSLMGLVTGLPDGTTTLRAAAKAKGVAPASLEITNYPITGPVFSGPWLQPFICETQLFKLPDGTTLGPSLDANCSARTVVQYVYWPTQPDAEKPAFKPLPDPAHLPDDVATTTTSTGVTTKFIVRVETGTMNRGIYQNAILFDPAGDAPPTPFAPPKAWNKRLIAIHGAGCPSGWYIQGAAEGTNVLDRENLGKGYALFINTLNHPTNSCNAILAAETTMMGKEHFIETFGVPFYTYSTGRSGGAYTSLQIADAFPGLIDGVLIGATFPDALAIAMSGLDAHLLTHYFTATNPDGFTDAQKIAVAGYQGMQAFIDAANQSQRTDPVPNRADIEGYQSARWNAAVPAELRYDPVSNPKGARPTIFDVARNVYGTNPATGAALRPYDNVGVQYGLNALAAGAITPAQFLDLNQRIGGFDSDDNYVASRTAGDLDAIKRTYQGGLMLYGGAGLAQIPVMDNATSRESGGYHYGWFHFALRDRLRQSNGGAENMVMWRSVPSPTAQQELFDRWMTAYKSDTSDDPQRDKVIRARPARDGCFDKGQFIMENLIFSSQPNSECSRLYPVYSNPRHEAGGPLTANVLKCQLKPIDAADYKNLLTSDEMTRLQTIFPGGVCDFSKPGVNQTPVVTWPSFGPSPKNLVYDSTKP